MFYAFYCKISVIGKKFLFLYLFPINNENKFLQNPLTEYIFTICWRQFTKTSFLPYSTFTFIVESIVTDCQFCYQFYFRR